MGAFGFLGAGEVVRRTIDGMSELVTESKRLGTSIENLQVLRRAAETAGVGLESVAHAFEKIEEARAKALTPGEEGQKMTMAFTRMGVSQEQLRTMSRDQLFMGPMRQTVSGLNPANMAAPMKEIFGRGFGEMIPVLTTDFAKLHDRMQAMGVLIETRTAVEMKLLTGEFRLMGQTVLARLAPALVLFAEVLYKAIGSLHASMQAWWGSIGAVLGNISTLSVGDLLKNPTLWIDAILSGVKQGLAGGLKTFRGYRSDLDEIKNRAGNFGDKDLPFTPNAPLGSGLHDSGNPLVKVGGFFGTTSGQIQRGVDAQFPDLVTTSKQQLDEQRLIRAMMEGRMKPDQAYASNPNGPLHFPPV
jgi:hypothetical protein